MVVWRGLGILAVVFIFGGLLLAQQIVDAVAGKGTYTANSALYGGLGAAIGGAATYALARWVERRNPPKILVDPTTGQQVVMKARDDLFFIPMKYWGLLAVGVGGGMFIGGLLGVL